MAKYNVRELQLRILAIAKAVDAVCDEHGLDYYMWAGTMIGAVRHKGFIPWDDDLDFAMPRPSYEKLIAHAKEWLPEQFEMVCAENDKVYPLAFAKVQAASTTLIERLHLRYVGGIYVDIFPIDGTPDNKLMRKLHFARYQYYKRVLYFLCRDPFRHGRGISSWPYRLARKMYTLDEVQGKIRRLLMSYGYNSSRLVADYAEGYRGAISKRILGTPTPYPYEDTVLKGVEDYDTYLSRKYGDYMTPPEAAAQRQHNFHYLDLTRPYRVSEKEHLLP